MFNNIFEIAAAYSFYIIRGHIFYDGTKRTGINSSLVFLEKNGYVLKNSVTKSKIIKFAVSIGDGGLNLEKIAKWYKRNVKKVKIS